MDDFSDKVNGLFVFCNARLVADGNEVHLVVIHFVGVCISAAPVVCLMGLMASLGFLQGHLSDQGSQGQSYEHSGQKCEDPLGGKYGGLI